MKKCTKCKKTKSISKFSKDHYTKDGYRPHCKMCIKQYRQANKQKRSESFRQWRIANKSKLNAKRRKNKAQYRGYATTYRQKHRELINARQRRHYLDYYKKQKDAVFVAYGGYKCIVCKEKRELCLTIDHINNDGAKHRKQIGGGTGFRLYRWLKQNNYPPGFQVLCRNCNYIKYRNIKASKQAGAL